MVQICTCSCFAIFQVHEAAEPWIQTQGLRRSIRLPSRSFSSRRARQSKFRSTSMIHPSSSVEIEMSWASRVITGRTRPLFSQSNPAIISRLFGIKIPRFGSVIKLSGGAKKRNLLARVVMPFFLLLLLLLETKRSLRAVGAFQNGVAEIWRIGKENFF